MSCAGKPRPLERATIDRIVARVFRERTSTLQQEAEKLDGRRLDASIARLRARLTAAVHDLPDRAFQPRPDAELGEAGWTAGQIVSHNTDRLLWALAHAEQTLGGGIAPRPPDTLTAIAAEPPLALQRADSIAALESAAAYVAALLPTLHQADHGQRSGSTHHGELGLSGWLLLIVIHDDDHLRQLLAKQVEP
jgi:hypothetical protein